MKRRVVFMLTLLVALVGGAIVNFAVAWGLWMLPVETGGRFQVLTPGESEIAWWKANAPSGFAAEPSGYVDRKSIGRYTTDMDYTDMTPGVRRMNTAMRMRAGWPLDTFEGAMWSDPWARTLKRQHVYHPPQGWPLSQRGIPYRVLPRGFAINTLFYAFMVWLLFAASMALRKRRRIKRDLCPKCAYPVGTNEVCTECGAAVNTYRSR